MREVLRKMKISRMSAIVCIPLLIAAAYVLWGPNSVLDESGRLALTEISILAVMCIAPVAWRWQVVGGKAFTEPLAILSISLIPYYVLRGLLLVFRRQMGINEPILKSNPATNSDLAVTLAYVILGLFAFHLAYRFWRPPSATMDTGFTWSSRLVGRISAVCILAAVISTGIAIYAAGGIGNTLRYFGCMRVATAGYGYLLLGLGYWGICFRLLLTGRLKDQKVVWLPALCLLIANLCDAFIGNRMGILAAWATAFLIYAQFARHRGFIKPALAFLCFLAVAVGVAIPMARIRAYSCVAAVPTFGTVRTATATATAKAAANPGAAAKTARETKSTRTVKEVLTPAGGYSEALGYQKIGFHLLQDFVALDSFSTIVAAGNQHFPIRYGKTYLDSVLFVVPRFLWPTKPRSFSYEVGHFLFQIDTDIPPGFIGELYVNFRAPGIFIGMLVLGWVLRAVHRWTMTGNPVVYTVYSILAPYLFDFMGRSFIGGGTHILIPLGLMLPILYLLRATPAGVVHPWTWRAHSMAASPRIQEANCTVVSCAERETSCTH